MKTKICLYGPTGSGKTTISDYAVKNYNAELIKISAPLYELQKYFYEFIGKEISGQDGELLQFMAHKIEKEKSGWLANTFLSKIRKSSSQIILNDDCRLNSYYALKKDGFIFIKVYTSVDNIIYRQRDDHVKIDPNHPVELGFEKFQNDFTIDNNDSLDFSLSQFHAIMEEILHGN